MQSIILKETHTLHKKPLLDTKTLYGEQLGFQKEMEPIAFLIFSLLHPSLSVLAKAKKHDVTIHLHLNKSTNGEVKLVFDH